MDLYKYFQPHHNARLRQKALRHQELGELLEGALELGKACERAALRQSETPTAEISKEQFTNLLSSLHQSVQILTEMSDAHPGDEKSDLLKLIEERSEIAGWENWARILNERLKSL